MSIEGLYGAPNAGRDPRRAASAQRGSAGASFQDCLSQTAAAAQTRSAARPKLTREELLAALNDAKRTMVQKMKVGKEKQEEEDAWNKMMEYIDAWIDSLREEGNVEKTARAYSDYMSRRTARAADGHQKDLGDFIVETLEEQLGM